MRFTLLEMVRQIMSSMDSDEVNSINDTVESSQVANIIKMKYNDIVSLDTLPETYDVLHLTASGDPTKPTVMYLPSGTNELYWVKYNKPDEYDATTQFRDVRYYTVDDFFQYMYSLHTNETNVISYDIARANGTTLKVLGTNDNNPQYYTVLDNSMVLFDSYLADEDTTLQSSKTLAYVSQAQSFTMADNFVPHLDDRTFTLLFNEAKALCFAELKQTQHASAERTARRALIHLENRRYNAPSKQRATSRLPYYGRK